MDGRGQPFFAHPGWEHAGGGHPFLTALLIALLVVLVAAAALWLYRQLAGRRAPAAPTSPVRVPATASPPAEALAIVRLRYARGEIDRSEFRRMSADLGAPPVPDEAAADTLVSEPPPAGETP